MIEHRNKIKTMLPCLEVVHSILSSDHLELVQLISKITGLAHDADRMSAGLVKLKRKMLLHFFREETFVFPSSEASVPHALVLGLLTEHAGMLRMIDRILSYLKDEDIDRATDRLAGLSRLLHVHCEREEKEIYTGLEETGTIQAITEKARMKRLPKGWKCAIAAKYDGK
ncbi:MAG: hemerythrin domain-containing protein [Thermoplasmata archaeon]